MIHIRANSRTLRTFQLFGLAAIMGGLGWSGRPSLNCLALLYPFVYIQSRTRMDALSAVFYYATSTWGVLRASHNFFGSNSGIVLPLSIWLALIAVGSAPWIALFSSRFLSLSAIGAIAILAVPPLGLITVTHPLIAAGAWFPGTRWIGLLLPLLLIVFNDRLGTWVTMAVLIAASLVCHFRFHRPDPDSHIISVDTGFGAAGDGHYGLESQSRESALQRMALSHPNSLVLLPESVLPGWSATRESRWAETLAQLKRQRTGLLIGTTIPIRGTNANRNVLLSRGYTEQLSYVQRVPVPLGMWRIGSKQEGFPLMLRYPATIRVWNRRAGVLICYEQLLVWPSMQTLARDPELLLAPSHLYWAVGTPVPGIQRVSAQDWADLWGIPLYGANNL